MGEKTKVELKIKKDTYSTAFIAVGLIILFIGLIYLIYVYNTGEVYIDDYKYVEGIRHSIRGWFTYKESSYTILSLLISVLAFQNEPKIGVLIYLGLLLVIIGMTVRNIKAGKNQEVTPEQQENIDVADELIKYKKLLDQGVLTEAEFKAKKEQLLK